MAINRIIWKNGFIVSKVPEWNCPTCKKGILRGTKDSFTIKEGSVSKSYHKEEDWDPAWITGVFSGMLQCDNVKCQENIAVSGKMDVQEDQIYLEKYNDYDFVSHEVLMPQLFIPALEIFTININVPKDIAKQIQEAFYLYWVDIAACANKIRIVVELIMDYYKIRKTTIGSDGKRKVIALHHRIIAFKRKYADEADLLMAIKWIGNFGSHSSDPMTKDDILDGFEILEHVVHKLYETETKRISVLSKTINKRKGPIKKKKK